MRNGGLEDKMEGGNLLSGGVEELNEIKECLLELRGNQANIETLTEEEQRLEKTIKSLEKDIAEEIQTTVKKRKSEIEDSFERQIDKVRKQVKKIKKRRNRKKNSKMAERIDAETASLRADNHRLRLDAGTVIRQKRLPAFCNTKLYTALYAPSCFTDILVIIATILVTLLLIPCGVYFLLLPQEKIIYMIITYVITVIFFGGIYIAIHNRTLGRYSEDIWRIRELRGTIRSNKRKIRSIKRRIKRDRDESSYDLQSYDEELAELEKEEDDILAQKKEALETFENTTKHVIATEIREANEEKLSGLNAEYNTVCAKAKETEERIKALTLKIAGEYEPFLGKDLMSLDRLETLTNIILASNAKNISEAVAFYRQNMSKPQQE